MLQVELSSDSWPVVLAVWAAAAVLAQVAANGVS
jgi:hypothetical protein